METKLKILSEITPPLKPIDMEDVTSHQHVKSEQDTFTMMPDCKVQLIPKK
jgi:hypothetical protein